MEDLIREICTFHDVEREELTVDGDTVTLVTREDLGTSTFDGGAVEWTYTATEVTVCTENFGCQTFDRLFDSQINYF